MRFRRLSNTFPNKLPPLKKTFGLIHGRTPLQPGGAGGLGAPPPPLQPPHVLALDATWE